MKRQKRRVSYVIYILLLGDTWRISRTKIEDLYWYQKVCMEFGSWAEADCASETHYDKKNTTYCPESSYSTAIYGDWQYNTFYTSVHSVLLCLVAALLNIEAR